MSCLTSAAHPTSASMVFGFATVLADLVQPVEEKEVRQQKVLGEPGFVISAASGATCSSGSGRWYMKQRPFL